MKKLFFLSLLFICWIGISVAQEKVNILFLLDGSKSMYGNWGNQKKFDLAASTVVDVMETYYQQNPNVRMAIRVFGHQVDFLEQNCTDTKLEVNFYQKNTRYIRSVVDRIKPKGYSPIAYSMAKAARDFPPNPNERRILIFVSDGGETCGGDPCAVSSKLAANNIHLEPHVIGLGDAPHLFQEIGCIGSYVQAFDADDFKKKLDQKVQTIMYGKVINQQSDANQNDEPLTIYEQNLAQNRKPSPKPVVPERVIKPRPPQKRNPNTVESIFSKRNQNIQTKSTKPKVNLIKVDNIEAPELALYEAPELEPKIIENEVVEVTKADKKILNENGLRVYFSNLEGAPVETNIPFAYGVDGQYNDASYLVHSLKEGRADIMPLRMSGFYTLTAFTNPPQVKTALQLDKNSSKPVTIRAPQGYLKIELVGYGSEKQTVQAVIKEKSDGNIVQVQKSGSSYPYIAGKYSVEITTLPHIIHTNVEIQNGDTTVLRVKNPGAVEVSADQAMVATLFKRNGSKFKAVQHLHHLKELTSLTIQPGAYQVIYRPYAGKDAKVTKQKNFIIKSGDTYLLELEN